MFSFFFYLAAKRWLVKSRRLQQTTVSLPPASEPTTQRRAALVPIHVTVHIKRHRRKMLTRGFTFPTEQSDDPDAVQVDVAFLSYLPEGENNGNARLDSISYVTMAELLDHEAAKRKKKVEMGKNAYKHFKWYIRALKEELSALGPEKKFKIVHWLIASRNVGAFMIKSEFFPAISIIIAPRKEHWYAAFATENGRSKYGTRDREPTAESQGQVPTYIRCRDDYCANNCNLCQRAKNCICFLHKRHSAGIPTTIDEEEPEDMV